MELLSFFKSLKRYWAILVLVPFLTAIIAFIIALNMPNKYVSHARLASAIADKSQQLVADNNIPQDSRINEEFDNLLQTLTLNKVIDRVSYKLILHDLQSEAPYRGSGKLIKSLSPEEKKKAISTFTAYYNERKSLNQLDPNEKSLHKLLKSLKYDDESLRKYITASRMENSQYLNLEYASENPQLSAFVLNTLSEEFIEYYTGAYTANKNRSVAFLDSLVKVKQNTLVSQTNMLKQYKIDNGILNIDDQAKTIYGQIADMETKKGAAEKDMVAYGVALKNMDSRFSPGKSKYLESSVSGLNSDIVNTKEQITAANEAYVSSGFDAKYKKEVDSLQKKLSGQIYSQTENSTYNPSVAKENLVAQKLNLEISKDLAQNSVQTLDKELNKLNGNLQKLVPNLASIQAYQAKIEVANKEYQDILQKYNQASLEANNNVPVRIAEKAMPGDPVPNKKILLVLFSTIASFILCLVVLFIMFYFDYSIHSSDQLESSLDIHVIGSLNRINGGFLSLQSLWSEQLGEGDDKVFKNSLRSIRYEIENDLQNGNVLAITSLKEGEGKTFFTVSLAYAFSKINKKVLIIDGNFTHPDISNTINVPDFLEKCLRNDAQSHMVDYGTINIIGNKGGDNSLLELSNGKNINEFFAVLKTIYDVIIVETSALESLNKANAKEWISFADKVAVVFESGRAIDTTIARHIKYLKELGGKLSGMILNKVVSAPAAIKFNMLIDRPKKEPVVFRL